MADVAQAIGSIQDFFAAVAQELLVTLAFFFSLALWKYIGQRNKSGKQKKTKKIHSPREPSKKVVVGHSAKVAPDAKTLQNIKAAEEQMLRLLDQREFTRALNFFRTFERDGRDIHFTEALFGSLIQSAIRVGKVDVVERLLRSMQRNGTEPSREFWRTVLKMLSSRKHFEVCLNIFSIFGRSLPSDKVIFSCLINGALEHGAPDRAVAMLHRYREATDLDPRDYVLLLRTYVAVGDVDAAESVFRELGPRMTALMLNLVLLTCVQAKQPDRALERLHEACALQDSRSSEGDAAADPIVDVVSYNSVIKGFSQAGLCARCFDCLHEMRARNLEPDDVTFGSLLDMCITVNDMGAADQVVNLLMRRDQPVDTVVCTLFIKGLVRAQKLPKAVELYEEMKLRTEGSRPDIVTYSVLIKAHVDSHNLEQALLVVEDMVKAGHSPDDIILTHLLEGCRYVGNHALGKKLFEDMLAAGVKPSDFTLITMVKLHGRCGAHDDAYHLVKNWESLYRFKPSVIHYTCLMSGCLRTKNYDQAWEAYRLMMDNQVQPDETTLATLLPGMIAAQNWDRVLEIVSYAVKCPKPIHIATETLNNALTQVRTAPGKTIHASQLQALMQRANIRVAPRNARHQP